MRFEGTSTLEPVLGFLPTRGWRCRVRKLPNPRISIFSPLCRLLTMLSKIVSTIISESFRVISTTFETSSISSAFVIAGFSLLLVCAVFPPITFQSGSHGGRRRSGLPIVLLQTAAFIIFCDGALTEANAFLSFIQFDDLEGELLAHWQTRRVGRPSHFSCPVPAVLWRNFAAMAQSFDTRQKLGKGAEGRTAGDFRFHDIANLVRP